MRSSAQTGENASVPPALRKRIRRQLIGRKRRFFVVTAPGFEALCRKELDALSLEAAGIRETAGGVSFTAPLTDAWRANLHLRTAGRILMRIETVDAAHFSQLAAAAERIPWELYLLPGAAPTVRVTAQRCRLHHSDAIAERITAAIRARLGDAPAAGPGSCSGAPAQTLFLRGRRDRFAISIDMSGELLYKRGLKPHGGEAPLRETTAAAILMLSEYAGDVPVLDPMCGTGTFSIEAALAATRTPAGLRRDFAFMGWPSFLPDRWAYLVRQAQARIRPAPAPVFASDRSAAACSDLLPRIRSAGLSPPIHPACRDFFDILPHERGIRPGLLLLNPPYGERIAAEGGVGALYRDIFRHISRFFRQWRVAVILPDPALKSLAPGGLTATPFPHGGRRRVLLTGTIG